MRFNKKAGIKSLFLSLVVCLIIVGASVVFSDAPSGMVSYWKLDDGSGTTADDFMDVNDGTLVNGPTWVGGQVGGALDFDGTDDYVNVPDDPSLDLTTEITIESLVNFDIMSSGRQTILAKRGSVSDIEGDYVLRTQDNADELEFYYHDGTGWHVYRTSNANLGTGTWYHVAVSYTYGVGSSIGIYLDGTLLTGSWIAGNGDSAVSTNNQPTTIGGLTDAQFLDGTLDEVAIYNRALTADEISNNYNKGLAGLGYNADCDDYTDENDCNGDTDCGWCPSCSGNQWSGGDNRCVDAQTCNYACNVLDCGAQCDAQIPCSDTECDHLDGCVGPDYYDYDDVPNTCEVDCICTNNPCGNPQITYNDPRCVKPFIEAKWELPDDMPQFADCEGVPEVDACSVYDEAQCLLMGQYGCSWTGFVCTGTPTCEGVGMVGGQTKCEETPGCVWVTTQVVGQKPVIKCAAVCHPAGFQFIQFVEAITLRPPHEVAQLCIQQALQACEGIPVHDCVNQYIILYCPIYEPEYLTPEPPEGICHSTAAQYDPEFYMKEQQGICQMYTGTINPPFDVGKYTVFVKAVDLIGTYDWMENKFLYAECTSDADCLYMNDQCNDGVCVNYQCVQQPKQLSTPCDDGNYCSETDHCDGQGSCVQLTARTCSDGNECTQDICDESLNQCQNPPEQQGTLCGSARDCPPDACNGFFAEFYPDDDHDTCDGQGNCNVYSCALETKYCTDNDETDGVNTLECNAQCDQNVDCTPKLENDICSYSGSCDTTTTCSCNYASSVYCPQPGTVNGGICYYGYANAECSENGCNLLNEEMGCNNYCDGILGPIDQTGPTTSNVTVVPIPSGSLINITATETETCANTVVAAEYYFDTCGTAGAGNAMAASDGLFNEQVEDVEVKNLIPKDEYGQPLNDGRHTVCVRGKNSDGYWGACVCTSFELDRVAPNNPDSMALNGYAWVTELLVCGNNPTLTGHVCDGESKLQAAEYFMNNIDDFDDFLNWEGYSMSASDGAFDETCEDVEAIIDISQLEEGTHYVKFHAKDKAENWGKLTGFNSVSFIKDTTDPVTDKVLNPYNGNKVDCGITEVDGKIITNGCYYVKQGTTIDLSAVDPDPQGTDEYAGNVVIHYKVWWSYDGSSWSLDQEGSSSVDGDITITLSKDSYHLIEYWAEDLCGNQETHHFELDIVDTQVPQGIKTVGDPKVACDPADPSGCKYWVKDHVTEIKLDCVDPQPHPVGVKKMCYKISYDNPTTPWLTNDYCIKYGGQIEADECCVYSGLPYTFKFDEDSLHDLHYYCEDKLGNRNNVDIEYFKVDSVPPTTTKVYGTPLVEGVGGYPKWITSNTPITLIAVDGGDVCAVGVDKIYWRNTLVPDIFCLNDYECQHVQGSGIFNEYSGPFYKKEESCHLIEYYSVDKLGNAEKVKTQCVYVENTPPVIEKTVDTPKHECTPEEKAQHGSPDYGCWYITQNTKITLDCDDVMPHPVNQVTLYYKDYLLNTPAPAYTPVPGGYVEIQKTEDSEHVLEFYCVDALGNSYGTAAAPHKEIDIVDTQKPVSQKTLGTPKHACESTEQTAYYDPHSNPAATDGCYFITKNTQVTLTCSDGQPHPVDHVKIFYRTYLAGTATPPTFSEDSNSVTFTYSADSAHVLEWYCVDELGNRESTHVEYDIVDTVPPVTTKEIIGPQYYDTQTGKRYIDGVTEIKLTCTDPEPHPVDHEVIKYRYRVDDGTWTSWYTYSGAFSFPEESKHELEFYCTDALGNEETHQFEIDYVDKTPPTTTKTYGKPYYKDGSKEWITSKTLVFLSAADNVGTCQSGVKATYWRNTIIDEKYCSGEWDCQQAAGSGGWNTYTGEFYKPEQSCHLIEYYSVDNVEKTEIVKKQCVYVENTPPVSQKTLGTPKHECTVDEKTQYGINDCWYITKNTDVTLTCQDGQPHPVDQVKIHYKTDWKENWNDPWQEGNWIEDSSQVTFKYDKDSFHRLTWYCVDALGNTESPQHVELDIVDTVPPVSQKAFDGMSIPCSQLPCANQADCDNYINQSTKIILSCSDPEPHPVDHQEIYYRYSVDDVLHQDWTLYTAPIQYDEDSKHTLEWYCIDELGNKETTHTQIERVDTTPPVTTKVVGDPNWDNGYWVTSNTPITLTTVDKEVPCASGAATLYYEVWWDFDCDGYVDTEVQSNSVTPDNCQLSTTLYLGEECLHELRWYAVDALGNKETEHVQYHNVDNTPPHILILKPVDGWYSDGEDIPIVARAFDRNRIDACGEECDMMDTRCAVGIEDGKQCSAYLLDFLPQFKIVELDTKDKLLYNVEAHECQGYATIPEQSGIPDGVVILIVRAEDNLGNEAGSFAEILRAIYERCQCEDLDGCGYECIRDALQTIVTIWNLPKIGIDNYEPKVDITSPSDGFNLKTELLDIVADITDGDDGDVSGGTTSGTPCYVTLDGVSLGTLPYSNTDRKCEGEVSVPRSFLAGEHELKVEMYDNAGNSGSDSIQIILPDRGRLFMNWHYVPDNTLYVDGYAPDDETQVTIEVCTYEEFETDTCTKGITADVDPITKAYSGEFTGTNGWAKVQYIIKATSGSLTVAKNFDILYEESLQDQIDALDDRLTDAEADIIELDGRMDNAEADIYQLQSDVSALQTTVADLQSQIDDLVAQNAEQQAQIDDLLSRVSALENGLAALEARVLLLEQAVVILQNQVANLIIAVNDNTQQIIALWEDDANKWIAIHDLQAQDVLLWQQVILLWEDDTAKWIAIHALEDDVADIWEEIESLWDAIEALHVPSIKVNTAYEQSDVNVILDITTNEPAYCRYGLTASGYDDMTNQFVNGEGTTEHTTPVVANEGLNFYFVSCQDLEGHSAPTSEVVIFKVGTEFCGLDVDLFNGGKVTWRIFWLPRLFIDDLTNDKRVENVLKGIKGKYEILYYHDDSIPGSGGWKSYDPNRFDEHGKPINSLTEFNEQNFEPYAIKMIPEVSGLEEIPVYDDNNPECGWTLPECSDGLDNDADGYWDYGYDDECISAKDDEEAPVCGDGLVEGNEECDDNGANGIPCNPPYDDSCQYCSDTCELITLDGNYCGDGNSDLPQEECDDGNNVDGDGCSANCVIEFCGDGIIQAGLGEECDDNGANGIPCNPPYDGSCNYCTADCKIKTLFGGFCGDGNIDAPDEECEVDADCGLDEYCDSCLCFEEQQQPPVEGCYGTPDSESCGLYNEEQCDVIPNCNWNTGSFWTCSGGCYIYTAEQDCLDHAPQCGWYPTSNTCFDTMESPCAGAYDETSCEAIQECNWIEETYRYCSGTPNSCEEVASNWPSDPRGKCEETPGCYWGVP